MGFVFEIIQLIFERLAVNSWYFAVFNLQTNYINMSTFSRNIDFKVCSSIKIGFEISLFDLANKEIQHKMEKKKYIFSLPYFYVWHTHNSQVRKIIHLTNRLLTFTYGAKTSTSSTTISTIIITSWSVVFIITIPISLQFWSKKNIFLPKWKIRNLISENSRMKIQVFTLNMEPWQDLCIHKLNRNLFSHFLHSNLHHHNHILHCYLHHRNKSLLSRLNLHNCLVDLVLVMIP